MIREKFELDLKELQSKLVELGDLTETALNKAMDAFHKQNIDLALEVIEDDKKVDILEEEINDFAIILIAKQQPVAIDLRRIVTAIKIAADIERMADFAVNIAKAAIRIGNEPFIKPIDNLLKMHEIATNMLSMIIKAFNEEDVLLAKKVADMDDQVDALYGETIRELFNIFPKKNESINQVTQLAFVSRYIERTADHATNISENIFYLVKGRHYDLND
ncbi:phosphate signaling complex protein PhoU [Aeribacillus alveayuensis]|uniref:Phosphate-specific transport system accessory protein PhoU n=1 Tax=Aeribacillus alveayuensis TaxID=279215 RepID=A0ABT9VK55_9BACI|nr:phosphate transport system protein [Bacillus alveayuensis]